MKIRFEHPALDKPIMVQGRYEVCPQCGGHGVHDRRDLDCSALVDSMNEDGDYDGIEDYYNGHYEEVCTECNGRCVVPVPELPAEIEKIVSEWDRSAAEDRAYEASEMRALGCY